MNDIEQRLADAGAAWRATQPPPPAPDVDRLDVRTPNRWPVLAAAAAVVAVLAGTALALGRPDRPVLPAASPAVPSPTASRPLSAEELVLRDGDTVEASGVVIADDGGPVYFCSWLPTAAGGSAAVLRAGDPGRETNQCRDGVPATGVDLGGLSRPERNDGGITGTAWLRGVWRGGVLHVTEQATKGGQGYESEIPDVLRHTPCAPPAGGWRGPADHRLGDYVDARPDQFYGVGVNRPEGYRDGTEVSVVGVAKGDLAAVQKDLRARFGSNICTVRVLYSARELAPVREAAVQLMQGGRSWINGVGTESFKGLRIYLTWLDQHRLDELRAIGLQYLTLDVWLKPVR
jgi:hypothetical protein